MSMADQKAHFLSFIHRKKNPSEPHAPWSIRFTCFKKAMSRMLHGAQGSPMFENIGDPHAPRSTRVILILRLTLVLPKAD